MQDSELIKLKSSLVKACQDGQSIIGVICNEPRYVLDKIVTISGNAPVLEVSEVSQRDNHLILKDGSYVSCFKPEKEFGTGKQFTCLIFLGSIQSEDCIFWLSRLRSPCHTPKLFILGEVV